MLKNRELIFDICEIIQNPHPQNEYFEESNIFPTPTPAGTNNVFTKITIFYYSLLMFSHMSVLWFDMKQYQPSWFMRGLG